MNPDLGHTPEQPETDNSELQKFFDEPLKEEDFELWKFYSQLRESALPPAEKLLDKQLGDFSYKVYVRRIGDFEYMEFQLIDSINQKPAEISFERSLDGDDSWDMFHRSVDSKAAKVSGTKFLRKAEEYMATLNKQGYRKVDRFTALSRQPNVTEWLLKNDYRFSNEASEDGYLDFKEHPDNYAVVKINQGDNLDKDEFLFKKSALEQEPLKSILANTRSLNEAVDYSREGTLKLDGLVKFDLEKDL